MESNGVRLLDKLLHWFHLDLHFLNCSVSAQKLLIDLRSRDLTLQRMVEDVLRGGVFLDSLYMRWNGDVEALQLDGDGGQGVDHLGLVVGQSARILQIDQTFLDDLLDFVLGDQAEVFGSRDGHYFSGLFCVLVLVEADEGARLCVYAFYRLASFADYQSDQPHGHLELNFVGAVDCAAVHFPLGFDDQVELLAHSFDCLGVAFDEDVPGLGARSTGSGYLHLQGS